MWGGGKRERDIKEGGDVGMSQYRFVVKRRARRGWWARRTGLAKASEASEASEA